MLIKCIGFLKSPAISLRSENPLLSKARLPAAAGPCADTHGAVHSGDGGSEDPILEGLLDRTSGDPARQQVKENKAEGWRFGGRNRECIVRQCSRSPPTLSAHTQTPPRFSRGTYGPSGLPSRGAKRGLQRADGTDKYSEKNRKQAKVTRQSTKPLSCQENPLPWVVLLLKNTGKKMPKAASPSHSSAGHPPTEQRPFCRPGIDRESPPSRFPVLLPSPRDSRPHPPTKNRFQKGPSERFSVLTICCGVISRQSFLKLERYGGNPGAGKKKGGKDFMQQTNKPESA